MRTTSSKTSTALQVEVSIDMTEETKKFIADVLDSEFCFDRQEDGVFYQEIYADYRDSMSNKDASEILSAQDPMQRFWEKMDEWYWNAQLEYEGEVADKVKAALTDDDTGLFPEGLTDEEEQEVDDYLKEIVCFTLPEKHYLKQEFKVNIMVDTGDGNYDHTLNSVYPCYCGRPEDAIDDKAAIVWLTKKQGYTKTQMNNALKKGDIKDPKGYLQSLRQELANLPSHMSVLTFLAKMTFEELLQLNSYIRLQDRNGRKYDAAKNPDCGYIVIDKKAETGLYDPWNGGSVFEIELEKDARLPIRFIRSALPDGGDGYSIDSVYGMSGSCWREVVKEIHGISDERLARESAV